MPDPAPVIKAVEPELKTSVGDMIGGHSGVFDLVNCFIDRNDLNAAVVCSKFIYVPN